MADRGAPVAAWQAPDKRPGPCFEPQRQRHSADSVIEENMTPCVESYIGQVGGAEGVNLEEQVLVTVGSVQRLSIFPFEDDLMI
jgi:Xaa-Pro aminopeptidase